MFSDSVRGRGAPIRTRKQLSSEDVESNDESDEVRIVEARGPTGPVKTRDVPFAEYVDRECEEAAAEEVLSTIEARATTQVEGIDAGVADESAILVIYRIWIEEWGDSISKTPSHDFETIVELTPSTVTVEVELAGRERRRELPVYVEQRRGQFL